METSQRMRIGFKKDMNITNAFMVKEEIVSMVSSGSIRLWLKSLVVCTVFIVGCEVQEETVYIGESPDGSLVISVIRSNSHATTPFVHEFFLSPKPLGEEAIELGKSNLMLKTSRLREYDLEWLSPSTLVVKYQLHTEKDEGGNSVQIISHKNYYNWEVSEGRWKGVYFHLIAEIAE